MRRRRLEFFWNPKEWEWRTLEFDHCVIRHLGPITITTFRAWAKWTA